MSLRTAGRAVLAALLWFGCGKSDSNSIVVVTVTAPPNLPVVTQLRTVVRNAGSSDTRLFPQVQSATPIQFDTTFAVTFPKSHSGELEIAVDALSSALQVVASGSNSVVIVSGGRTDAIVHLVLGATGDAGAPGVVEAIDVGTAAESGISDSKIAADALQLGTDSRDLGGGGSFLGSGGRYGTGGVMGGGGMVPANGGSNGSNPFLGGNTGSTGGIDSSAGVVGAGGRVGSGGFVGGGGVLVQDGGEVEPCLPVKTIAGTGSGNTGTLGTTGAYCFRTADTISAWNCSNLTGRTVKVNGVVMACGSLPLPAKVNGYYYFEIGPGGVDYASIYWY